MPCGQMAGPGARPGARNARRRGRGVRLVLLAVALWAGAGLAAPVMGRAQTVGAAIPVRARDTARETVAVVDVQYLFEKCTAWQSYRMQNSVQGQRFQEELTQQEQSLRDIEKQLATQRTVMGADAFDARRKELEQHMADMQRLMQDRKRRLDNAFSEAGSHLRDTMVRVVGEVARENGVTIVLPRASVIYMGEGALDLTQQVFARLNQELPDIKVNIPN